MWFCEIKRWIYFGFIFLFVIFVIFKVEIFDFDAFGTCLAGYKQLQLNFWSLLSGADTSPYSDVVFHATTGTTEGQGPTSSSCSFHAHKVVLYHVRACVCV
jgi:hypothetical protein